MARARLPRVPGCAIAVPFDRRPRENELAELQIAQADIFELRLDLADCHSPDYAAELAAAFATVPLLVTCRSTTEGGRGGPDSERLALLAATVDYANAIDIELASTDLVPQVAELAQANDLELIISHHNMHTTPECDKLNAMADQAYAKQANIVKIVTVTHTAEDVAVLEKFLAIQLQQDREVAVMGMGPSNIAINSRITLARKGSIFMFAQASIESAPGQPTLESLAKQLHR